MLCSNKQTYCICYKPAEKFMVTCEQCKEKFHGRCVNLKPSDITKTTYFVCASCSETKKQILVHSREEYLYVTRRSRYAQEFKEKYMPKTYCFCGKEDDGSTMVECGVCEEWFHLDCVGYPPPDSDDLQFVCKRCSECGNIYVTNKLFQKRYAKNDCIMNHMNLSKFEYTPRYHKKENVFSLLMDAQRTGRPVVKRKTHLRNRGIVYKRIEFGLTNNAKPWTVRCLRKSNRFIVGSSTGTLDIYTIPSMITDSNIKSLTTYTTSHDAGLSYANQFPNPYGNILTSSNWFDGRLVFTNLDTGKELYIVEGHTQTVRAVDFNMHSNCMLTASFDKSVVIWDTRYLDTKPGKIMRLEGHLGPVSGARFFGYNIITISHDQTIRVWDIRKYPGSKKDYQAVAKITVDNVPLTSMGVTFDLSKLAINTEVNKILVVDTNDILNCTHEKGPIEPIQVLEGHLNSNWGTLKAKFVPGRKIAAGSEDGCLNIWDENGELRKHYLHSSCVWEISFSRATQSIVTCSEDASVCVLRMHNEDSEYKCESPKKSPKRKNMLKKDVLCRFRDSNYYHASIKQRHKDNTYSVRFRDFFGFDAEMKVGSSLLLPGDILNCPKHCLEGHSVSEIVKAQAKNPPLQPLRLDFESDCSDSEYHAEENATSEDEEDSMDCDDDSFTTNYFLRNKFQRQSTRRFPRENCRYSLRNTSSRKMFDFL